MSEGSSGEVNRTVMEEKSKQQQGSGGSLAKARSCKGYLYYSSTLKSKDKNPRCVGIPRTLRHVPDYGVGKSEAEALRTGKSLADFYYGCLGYSVHITEKDSTSVKQHTKTQLPICSGLEILADRRTASSNTSSVPTRIQNRNDSRELPQHQNHRPTPNRNPTPTSATATNTDNGFVTRFTRNANLVASGVMKNLKRVGNYVKEHLDDYLDEYRKRPK